MIIAQMPERSRVRPLGLRIANCLRAICPEAGGLLHSIHRAFRLHGKPICGFMAARSAWLQVAGTQLALLCAGE
jgi:hypothetical protein